MGRGCPRPVPGEVVQSSPWRTGRLRVSLRAPEWRVCLSQTAAGSRPALVCRRRCPRGFCPLLCHAVPHAASPRRFASPASPGESLRGRAVGPSSRAVLLRVSALGWIRGEEGAGGSGRLGAVPHVDSPGRGAARVPRLHEVTLTHQAHACGTRASERALCVVPTSDSWLSWTGRPYPGPPYPHPRVEAPPPVGRCSEAGTG